MNRVPSLILILVFILNWNCVYAENYGRTSGEMRAGQYSGICPVIRKPALKEYAYTYEGKTYNFCCQACSEEFKKAPGKYISKIKEISLVVYRSGFSPESITVKKEDIVKLDITSGDVTHVVSIRAYDLKAAVKKDEHKLMEFVANKEGVFRIFCLFNCGGEKSGVEAKLIVEK